MFDLHHFNYFMKKKISILIVVYNKRLCESETINALFSIDIKNLNIVVVNNGPQILPEDDIITELRNTFTAVTLKNFTTNKPLSWVYNDFINENYSDRYIILDDDTEVTSEYFEKMVFSNEEYMIGLPKMISSHNNKQYTPFFNGEFKNDVRGYITNDLNFSITSAIVLSKELIDIIKIRFGTVFDERFALYCIDNTLFKRIETIVKEGIARVDYLSNVSLLHDFSNIHSSKQPKWRMEEKLIGDILALRHYVKAHKQVVKQVLLKLGNLEFRDCYIILTTYMEGKHPRCRRAR